MAERDLDEVLRRMSQTKVNRRGFLAAAGLTGTAAFLAACGPGGGQHHSRAGLGGGLRVGCAVRGRRRQCRPELRDREGTVHVQLGARTSSPDNMDKFKAEFGVETFTYDVYDNNEVLIAKLQGGASGYDIAAPTAEYVPGHGARRASSRSSTCRASRTSPYINKTFKGLWWDPTDEYQVPKDYGTTGILYMKSLISKIPQSWQEFYEVIKGEASGKTVFVDSMGDVFVFPLKMLGYSLNTVDQAELDEAREHPARRRAAPATASTRTRTAIR